MSKVYEANYAGNPVRISFLVNETKRCFRHFLAKAEGESYDVRATPADLDKLRPFLPADAKESYVEYRCLIELIALELLKHDCCIFHSVSCIWNGKAFLFAGPSGIGKTTQYLNWQKLYPGEIEMISGDMPVLKRSLDGKTYAFPSSWNGKERIGSMKNAPVEGIVFLEQGDENIVRRMSPKEALIPLLEQFMARPRTKEEIISLTGIADQILRNIPIWKMVNKGDSRSTILLRKTLSATKGGCCDAV